MGSNDSVELRSMRTMAWERAKGELRSMLQTFWEHDSGSTFEELKTAIKDFVTNVEDNGLQE